MEVFAGFVEHTDAQVGRLIDGLDAAGPARQHARSSTSSATTARAPRARRARSASCWPRTTSPTPSSSRSRRWTRSAGSTRSAAPKTDNMYHAGWAWAGGTPFQHTKLVASHFGGTRNPMVDLLAEAASSRTRRRAPQFHHVNDIAPTIYEVLGITPPKVVERLRAGPDRRRQHGLHLRRRRRRPAGRTRQYFDNNGSRGIYQRRLVRLRPSGRSSRGTHGQPRPGDMGLAQGRLGALRPDARTSPRRTTSRRRSRSGWPSMKALFLEQAKENKVFPIGAGIWLRLHPEDRVKTPYTQLDGSTRPRRGCRSSRRPASAARATTSTIDAEFGENASGVLYALGGAGGGLTLYMDNGQLVYEYNMMIIERYTARSAGKLAAGQAPDRGRHRRSPSPARPAEVVLTVDGSGGCPHDRRSAPCRRPSPPARPSTSASTSARRCRSPTSTGGRSGSTARSTR